MNAISPRAPVIGRFSRNECETDSRASVSQVLWGEMQECSHTEDAEERGHQVARQTRRQHPRADLPSLLQAASDLRMERLIHAVSEGVVTVDEERRIVLFNRAAEAMFGVAAGDALGTCTDLLSMKA